MYSFQGTFCHQRKFVMYWRSYAWFIFWCLMFFTCYEIGRILFIKGYEKLKFRNESKNRNRNDHDHDEERHVDLIDV